MVVTLISRDIAGYVRSSIARSSYTAVYEGQQCRGLGTTVSFSAAIPMNRSRADCSNRMASRSAIVSSFVATFTRALLC